MTLSFDKTNAPIFINNLSPKGIVLVPASKGKRWWMKFWRTLGLGKYYIPCDNDRACEAFMEAADFLPKNPGGHIYVPGAELTFEAAFNPQKANVTIEGAGPSTILRNENASTHHLFNLTNSNWFTVKNVAFDGNKANLGANDKYAIYADDCDYLRLEKLYIHDCSDAGIYLNDCASAEIVRSRILTCQKFGVKLYGACDHSLIEGLYVYGTDQENADGYDIAVTGGAGIVKGMRIIGNRCVYNVAAPNDSGVLLVAAKDCTIGHNNVRSYKAGIWVGGATKPCEAIVVEGNTAHSEIDAGIGVNSSPGCQVNTNICHDCGESGIHLAGSSDCLVDGNVCFDNGQSGTPNFQDGIQVTHTGAINPTGILLSANRCFDTGGATQLYGIAIRGNSDDCTLDGNDCEDNATAPYFIAAAATNCPIRDGRVDVMAAPVELTIAVGVITVTRRYHAVDTEADAATDNLDTINGFRDGMTITLTPETAARDVTIRDDGVSGGNIAMNGGAAFTMLTRGDKFTAIYDARLSLWIELGRITV